MLLGVGVGFPRLSTGRHELSWTFNSDRAIQTGFYINLPVGAVVGGLLILLRVPEVKAKPPVGR